jgi:CubicO group peptidase (beta-lactamase class C family)
LSDHKIFPSNTINNNPEYIFYFQRPEKQDEIGNSIKFNSIKLGVIKVTLNEFISETKTAAFIIIRNDTVLYETYSKKYNENSLFNTFSVTKAFITTLVGLAIDEGKIQNVDQAITDYIPELSEKSGFNKISIKHLLNHTSGIEFNETRMNLFSDNSRYYYGRNLRKLVLSAKIKTNPGTEFHYSSVNTQLLGLVLERATGTTLSNYLEEKIWQRIGMQYDASWSLDRKRKEPFEKCFSCLNCRAIDMAKLGRLYLNKGIWNGDTILSQGFIHEATKRDTTDGGSWNFHYNFRLGPEQYGSFYTRGLYGQLIFIYPEKKIIIVRLGEAALKYNPYYFNDCLLQIIDQL